MPDIWQIIEGVQEKITPVYAPSSIEKKRAVMMYMLFWVIIAVSNKKVNSFEYFHLKQAIWWWLCFILILIASIALTLIPWIKYIGLIALLAMVIIFIIIIRQARNGKYYVEMKTYGVLGVFPSLGTWLVNLFELTLQDSDIQIPVEGQTTDK